MENFWVQISNRIDIRTAIFSNFLQFPQLKFWEGKLKLSYVSVLSRSLFIAVIRRYIMWAVDRIVKHTVNKSEKSLCSKSGS